MTNKKIFEEKIKNIYPQISDELSTQVTEQLFKFWWDIIENIDKLELEPKKDIN